MTPKYFTVALFFILICELMLPVLAYTCVNPQLVPQHYRCEYDASCMLHKNDSSPNICNNGGYICLNYGQSIELDPNRGYTLSYYYLDNCIGNPGPDSVTYIMNVSQVTPTPTPTPAPSENCVTKCGYTWNQGFTPDDVLLDMCIWSVTPLNACQMCSWQMEMMQNQYPCVTPPSPVPTYDPTPMPTVPPPPTIPTIVPGPEPPAQIVSVGDTDIHDVDFTVATIATIPIPLWNNTLERQNITSLVGNMTDPYLNGVDAFSVAMSLSIQHILYIPNWVMASVYTAVQPIAVAFAEIIVIVSEWGSVPLQLMRLALDNTPAGIQALLIYGVCLEMVIYLLRGET